MSIDSTGFLGNEIKTHSEEIVRRNKELFELSFDYNKFAQDTKYKFQIHSEDGQEVIAGCLFLKILNTFQALVILAKYGLPSESQILLRSIFEPLCILKLVLEDEEFHRQYILTDLIAKLKWFNVAKGSPDDVFDELRKIADDEIKRLSNEIEEHKAEEYWVQKLAELASLKPMYDTYYRLLSGVVHTSPRSLEEYISTDEEGKVCSINWGPNDKRTDIILLSAVEFLRMALNLMIYSFKVDGVEELQKLHTREKEFHKLYETN